MKRSLLLATAAALLVCTPGSFAQGRGGGGIAGGTGGGGQGGGLGAGGGAGGGNLGGVYIDPNGILRGDGKGKIQKGNAPKLEAELAARSEVRRVSLKQLDRQLRSALEQGEIPDSLRYVAGIVKIEYVVFDPMTNDVLIAGPAEKLIVNQEGKVVGETSKRAPIQLDDVAVALRCVLNGPGEATCSIDPKREGLMAVRGYKFGSADVKSGEAATSKKVAEKLGLQSVRTSGIPENSRFAHVMIEADFRMKRMALGLERVSSIINHLDTIVRLKANNVRNPNLVRWWFVPNYDAVLSNREGTIFKLRGQGVRLETEEMAIDERGGMRSAGGTSEDILQFAETFTKMFPKMETSTAVFGDLRNLYDLMMVAGLIKHTNHQAWVKDLALLDPQRFELTKMTSIRETDPVVTTKFNSRTESRNGQEARITSVVAVYGGVSIKPGDVLGKADAMEVGGSGALQNLMPSSSGGSAGLASGSNSNNAGTTEPASAKWWSDVSKSN